MSPPCLSGAFTIFKPGCRTSRWLPRQVRQHLKPCHRHVAALLILIIPGFSYARESLPNLQFSLKPRLCVLADDQTQCQDQLEVEWASDRERSLCLYQNDQTTALHCWSNQRTGEYRFKITTHTSTDFQLREEGASTVLGREIFEVVHQQKRYRKSRRNPWNFF